MTIAELIESHLAARWQRMGEMGWQGVVTQQEYFSANRSLVRVNIANGLEPDGRGGYNSPIKDLGQECIACESLDILDDDNLCGDCADDYARLGHTRF